MNEHTECSIVMKTKLSTVAMYTFRVFLPVVPSEFDITI